VKKGYRKTEEVSRSKGGRELVLWAKNGDRKKKKRKNGECLRCAHCLLRPNCFESPVTFGVPRLMKRTLQLFIFSTSDLLQGLETEKEVLI